MTECIHELDIASCGICSPRQREWVGQWPDRGPVFPARFPGECDCCGTQFPAGEYIRADGEGGWLCGDCGAEP